MSADPDLDLLVTPTIAAHDDDELAAVAFTLGNAGTRLDGIALVVDPAVPAGLVRVHVPPFAPTLTRRFGR